MWLRLVLTDSVLQGISVFSVSSRQFKMLTTGELDQSVGTMNLLVTGSWKCVNSFYPTVVDLKRSLSSPGKRHSVITMSESIVFPKHTCFGNPVYYEIINYPLYVNRCILSKDLFLRIESHFSNLLSTLAQCLRT